MHNATFLGTVSNFTRFPMHLHAANFFHSLRKLDLHKFNALRVSENYLQRRKRSRTAKCVYILLHNYSKRPNSNDSGAPFRSRPTKIFAYDCVKC